MIVVCWLFALFFLCALFETLMGASGLLLPLLPAAVAYVVVTGGWRMGLTCAVLAGATLDALYGRGTWTSPVTLSLVVCLAAYWTHRGLTRDIQAQTVPGLVAGLIYAAGPLLLNVARGDGGAAEDLMTLIIAGAFSAFCLPLLVLVLDAFSDFIRAEKYVDAWKRLSERD